MGAAGARMTLQLRRRAATCRWPPPSRTAGGAPTSTCSGDAATASSSTTTSTPLPDPRSRRQPDGVHGLSARRSTPRRTRGRTRLDGTPARRAASSTSCTSARSRPRARSTPPSTGSTTSSTSASTSSSCCRSTPSTATHNWGYDGVLWYAVHEPYGGPAAYQRFVDACHARGLAVDPGRRLQPPRSERQLPARVRPVPARRSRQHVGRVGRTSTSPTPTWSRGYIIDNALMWLATTTSTGCGSTPCTPSSTTAPCTCSRSSPSDVDALSAHVGRPLTLIAESDLNDPRIDPAPRGARATASRRSGATTSTTPCTSPSTGETAGYYADFAPLDALAKTCSTRGFFHDGTCVVVPRPRARPPDRHGAHARLAARRRSTRTTTRSATAPRATGSRHRSTTAGSRSPRR